MSIVKASDGGEACVCDLTKRGTWAYYSLIPGALERSADVLSAL